MNLISPKVMVNLDGGVSSQMHQYLLGQLYAEKGYKVCYDLTFFDQRGGDLNNQFIRNFDLLKTGYPNLFWTIS